MDSDLISDLISDVKGEEIIGTFYKRIAKKQIKKSLELKN